MRYILNRSNFLENKKVNFQGEEIFEQIKTSAVINESFENDITWGGSLIGRLFNSTLRRFKIGYSQTKIEPLVKRLEDELNYLLSSSLQGDLRLKFSIAIIKNGFEQMRNVCLSNDLTEEEKLTQLLGAHTGLYDPLNPKKNMETNGLVQQLWDTIDRDLPDLQKFIGKDRDQLLDSLSDFNDDLRKLTVAPGTSVQPMQNAAVNFRLNFMNILNKIKNSNLVEGLKFKSFSEFINEEKTIQTGTNVNVNNNDNKNMNTKQQSDSGENTNVEQSVPSESKITEKEVDELLKLIKGSNDEQLKNNNKVIDFIQKITNIPDINKSNLMVDFNGKKTKLADAISILKKDIEDKKNTKKKQTVEQGKLTTDGYITNLSYNYNLVENIGQQPSGTTGSSVTTVKEVWGYYKYDAEMDKTRLTQREVDELNAMKFRQQDMRYEPEKRPDPLISICRIFGQAHNLYFTEVIPSGRPNGRVSQKTFREYYRLGKAVAAKWEQNSAPEGPFAVKSIFNKWKTGVEKLLMNQEYRKIFANVKFVVPGAEDKFNDNYSYNKIFEAEDASPTTVSGRKDGPILFNFINDMLDKTKLDDFDLLRSTLMKQYFGLKVQTEQIKQKGEKLPEKPPTREDFESNIIYFQSLQNTKLSTDSSFYAIPIEKQVTARNNTYNVIYLQIVKTVDSAFIVRFTFNTPHIMKKFAEEKYNSYKYIDWSQKNDTEKNIYYGILKTKDISPSKKIKIFYGNVSSSSNVKEVYEREFTIKRDLQIESVNGNITINPSRLVFNDESKVNEIKDFKFCKKIFTNDMSEHDDNLNKKVESDNKLLIEVLKEKIQ